MGEHQQDTTRPISSRVLAISRVTVFEYARLFSAVEVGTFSSEEIIARAEMTKGAYLDRRFLRNMCDCRSHGDGKNEKDTGPAGQKFTERITPSRHSLIACPREVVYKHNGVIRGEVLS